MSARPDGVHTAGNSSQISDGSAALLMTTSEKAAELGLRPIARVHTAVLAGALRAAGHEVAVAVPRALPAFPAGRPVRSPVALGDGLFVAGDHRDTPSTQGALVSGRRAAEAVLAAR